jgi:hypothetical protein
MGYRINASHARQPNEMPKRHYVKPLSRPRRVAFDCVGEPGSQSFVRRSPQGRRFGTRRDTGKGRLSDGNRKSRGGYVLRPFPKTEKELDKKKNPLKKIKKTFGEAFLVANCRFMVGV